MKGRSACVAVLAAAASCFLAPEDRELAVIKEIVVPLAIAPSDTLTVSFTYNFGGCQQDFGVHVDRKLSTLTFSAVVSKPARAANCPDVLHIRHYRYPIPPTHRTDYALVFRQPGGREDTRVVRTR